LYRCNAKSKWIIEITPLGMYAKILWLRRNIEADLKTQWPGESLVRVLGCAVWTGNASYPLYVDDVAFSNSMTTEHNVLGPGVIGHILRNRSTNAATYAATDRWFHYDQVGSVLSESDNTGALAQTHWQDVFGNSLDTWQNGLIGGDRPGWHHNSKEYDGDSQLVYMYQRWYNPELGLFSAASPFPGFMEKPFVFARSSPIMTVDPTGLFDGIDGVSQEDLKILRDAFGDGKVNAETGKIANCDRLKDLSDDVLKNTMDKYDDALRTKTPNPALNVRLDALKKEAARRGLGDTAKNLLKGAGGTILGVIGFILTPSAAYAPTFDGPYGDISGRRGRGEFRPWGSSGGFQPEW